VMSAVANAENNHGLDVNDLVVSEAYVGKNLVMKRFAARGRGRASSIMKPFSQITVIVRQTEEDGAEKRRVPKAKSKAGAEAKKPAAKPAKAAKPAAKGEGEGKPAKPGKAPAKETKAAKAKPAKAAAAKPKKSAKTGKSGKETE